MLQNNSFLNFLAFLSSVICVVSVAILLRVHSDQISTMCILKKTGIVKITPYPNQDKKLANIGVVTQTGSLKIDRNVENVLGSTIEETTLTKKTFTFGVTLNNYENFLGELTSLENLLGKRILLISLYVQFGEHGNHAFPLSQLLPFRDKNVQVLLAWEPWDSDQGMNQSKDYLTEIPQGTHDEYLKALAQAIKEFGNTVTVRFAHEMNGNWYPWAGRPLEFKQALRYIVSLFKRENVQNVKWMWSINNNNVPVSPIETASVFYPGDDVVDIIGIDGFNFGTDFDYGGWRSFSDIFKPAYFFALRYNKPIAISEVSSSEIGGSKASWITDMLKSALPNNFPQISELVWFNSLKETDWRIQSSNASMSSLKNNLP